MLMMWPCWPRLRRVCQAQLSNVHAYATKWGLSINIDKTKVMAFTGCCGPAAVCSLQIDDKVVEQVVTFRYLGVETL